MTLEEELEFWKAAIHEAGHGVMAYCFGRTIRRIRIHADGTGGVHCAALKENSRAKFPEGVWRRLVQEEIMICLGGPLAEQKFDGSFSRESASVDLERANLWLKELDSRAEIRQFADRTVAHLRRHWPAVPILAGRLLRARQMNGAEVEAICRRAKVPRRDRI